jgi:hypothetical protein
LSDLCHANCCSIAGKSERSYAGHLWNEMENRVDLDKRQTPLEGSIDHHLLHQGSISS